MIYALKYFIIGVLVIVLTPLWALLGFMWLIALAGKLSIDLYKETKL